MLTLEHVRKAYGNTVAVDDLSLSVRRGEILGLLGPNGAGKSTTVNLAVGLLAPDTGRVVIDGGGNPQSPGVRARLGVAPQALALYELLSGVENLRFSVNVRAVRRPRFAIGSAWSLEFVGLTERSRERVADYSGGMKRRLNLASALVHDPELDVARRAHRRRRSSVAPSDLREHPGLKRPGCTLIYTTHYMEEAAATLRSRRDHR